MKKLWQYLVNQFLTATEGSYKKAVRLSNYHDADLYNKKASETLLVAIYNRYHTLHLALVSAYNHWRSVTGAREGQTMNVEQQLETAYKNMNRWDNLIQTIYPKGTPEYKAIFPDGRKPFIHGEIDTRINAYETLSENMEPYIAETVIEGVQGEVDAVFATLDGARDAQSGAKGSVKSGSGEVETARVNAMTMMYRNLGFSMDNFYDKPDYIESMFDLETLRETPQTHFTGTLTVSALEPICIRTMVSDDLLKLKSNGKADIKFYLANTKGGTNANFILVTAGEERTVTASEFNPADYGTYRYLTAENQSASNETQYIVDLEG